MKKKFSLRTQLTLFLLIFVIAILGLIYIFQTTLLDDFYEKSKIKTLEDVAAQIETSLSGDSIEGSMDQMVMSNEVCVRTVSNNSKYNNVGACNLKNLDDEMINKLAADTDENGGEKLFDNYKYQTGKQMVPADIYIYSKLIDIDNEKVMILVSTMITPLGATISTIKNQYVIIVATVIVMTVILALILSRFIVKPIKNINDESKNLPRGKYDAKNYKFITNEFEELNNTLSEANEDILKADKAKKELLGNVSHDLRTPLTMIVGYGEMIRDLPEENNENNINVIIDEAKRLSTLVDDLIDVSKMESGSIELNKKDISLNELLTGVYHQYEKYCESQNVNLQLQLIDDKTINVDEIRIKQVLYNFINNALNYNNKNDQKIIIGSEKVESGIRVFVYDNGEGIAKENIDHIWDRYYKVDKEHKRHHIGSGIGLSLSKQLLIAHDLKYGVESELGEYSKFYFDIKA